MKKIILCCLLALLFISSKAQNAPRLLNNAEISILTCGSGDELYTAFGHTAIRVKDPQWKIDVVYNYGTFDFNKPNFYTNFAKGKLIYSLSRKSFKRFIFEYEYEKRWIKEQILDLSTDQVNLLFNYLETNYRPENRDYLYDPLFNNCSSISGIILKEQLGNRLVFDSIHLKKASSFRELVREYLPLNTWGSFGIELAFGGITDQTASAEEHLFLPEYAMRQFRNATLNGKPLIHEARTLLDYPQKTYTSSFFKSPLFWLLLLLALVAVITYFDFKNETRNRWLDFLLFTIAGLGGIIILLLWLTTDHVVTQYNFNFLWLLPSNAFIGFYLLKKEHNIYWLKRYLWIALSGIALVVLIWIVGFQVFSPLNILLIVMLLTRYLLLLKRV